MRWMGVTSVLLLLLTWAALHDITAGEPSVVFEYALLILSGLWFTVTAGWLIARRRSVLGLASLAAVAVGVLAFWSLPRRGEPETAVNLLGLIPLVWFAALSVWMLVARGYRWVAAHEPAPRAGDFRVPGRG